MSYMDIGEQSSFLEVTLVHEMGAVYSKKDIKYWFVIFLVNIFLGPKHYFSICKKQKQKNLPFEKKTKIIVFYLIGA